MEEAATPGATTAILHRSMPQGVQMARKEPIGARVGRFVHPMDQLRVRDAREKTVVARLL
jgi:hypothetical protein